MKLLLTSYLVIYLLPGYTQQKDSRLPRGLVATLVAKNNKHIRRYEDNDVLKIYYRDSGQIVKAKGRLFIYDTSQVQLIPYGRKNIVTINASAITSIGLWRRGAKITAAVVGGIGAIAGGLALAMQRPNRAGVGGEI
jgi:hypothetical protein